jgi:hypothetical protein
MYKEGFQDQVSHESWHSINSPDGSDIDTWTPRDPHRFPHPRRIGGVVVPYSGTETNYLDLPCAPRAVSPMRAEMPA